ncbi:hypothetical protein FACS189454_07580 [Planctomycetales bacterium]|nr:hypothetical protein FACS189454_07580 [Planctomycetales bacterium]
MQLTKRDFLKTLTIAGTTLVGTSFNRAKGAENALPRFAVMSDTHFGSKTGYGAVAKVSRALRNVVQKGNLDAIFVVGDLTDHGLAAQYDQLLQVFKDTNIIPESQRVVFMMGNHEFYNEENPVENYTQKLGQPLHQYFDIKGYPFITLSLNSGNSSDYSKESQQFLAEKIEDAAGKYPDKPIFIFSHTPPQNTSYGSKSWGAAAFLETLNKYPQAVFFSGHTHTPIGDPRMVWQGNFTSINDGSVNYCCCEKDEVEDGVNFRNGSNTTEALIVNVQAGSKLDIERWDTFHNESMPNWVVDWKNKNFKTPSDKTAPVFESGVQPKVRVTGNGCSVSFPQAKDNEIVFRYFVEIRDGEKTVATIKKSSQFFLNSAMPRELTADFFGLPTGKKLTASVRALDSFDNESAAIVSTAFEI